ncbi:MAG: hypothetical protein ABEJ88_02000 [Halobacterium sp.]
MSDAFAVAGIAPAPDTATVEGDGETFEQPSDHRLAATPLAADTTVADRRNVDPADAPPFGPGRESVLAAANVPGGELAGE